MRCSSTGSAPIVRAFRGRNAVRAALENAATIAHASASRRARRFPHPACRRETRRPRSPCPSARSSTRARRGARRRIPDVSRRCGDAPGLRLARVRPASSPHEHAVLFNCATAYKYSCRRHNSQRTRCAIGATLHAQVPYEYCFRRCPRWTHRQQCVALHVCKCHPARLVVRADTYRCRLGRFPVRVCIAAKRGRYAGARRSVVIPPGSARPSEPRFDCRPIPARFWPSRYGLVEAMDRGNAATTEQAVEPLNGSVGRHGRSRLEREDAEQRRNTSPARQPGRGRAHQDEQRRHRGNRVTMTEVLRRGDQQPQVRQRRSSTKASSPGASTLRLRLAPRAASKCSGTSRTSASNSPSPLLMSIVYGKYPATVPGKNSSWRRNSTPTCFEPEHGGALI